MNMPKVSIICPVYNAEKYIHRCIDSIIAQTLTDWELILVDDGSKDKSGTICDEYAQKDSRIRVIHKENGGVSMARQTGLEAADGEYLIHVDSDDWVEPEMLQELYEKAESDSADMVICDYYDDFDGVSKYHKQQPTSLAPDAIIVEMFQQLQGFCWNKLVMRSCVVNCKAYFPDGVNFCEDVCFNIQLLKYGIKVTYLSRAFYHYIQNPSSITHNVSPAIINSYKRYVSFLSAIIPENSYVINTVKEDIKRKVFVNRLLSDYEMKQLYPEVKSYSLDHSYLKPVYRLAFTGHQKLAYKIFEILLFVSKMFRKIVKTHV